MPIYIDEIILLAPPFSIGEINEETISNGIDLTTVETPSVLFSANYLNTSNGQITRYNSESIQYGILGVGSNFIRNKSRLTFLGNVTIDFSSIYPIQTYSKVMQSDDFFVGEERYNYQRDRATIRYTLEGSAVSFNSQLYKKPIIIRRNMAGSDNTILKYKLFYQDIKSAEGKVEFFIVKRGNSKVFYNV